MTAISNDKHWLTTAKLLSLLCSFTGQYICRSDLFAWSVYENSMNVFYCSKSSEPSCKVAVSEADRAKSCTARWRVISADWYKKSFCMRCLCTAQQSLLIIYIYSNPTWWMCLALQKLQGDVGLFQVLNNDVQLVWVDLSVEVCQEDNAETTALLPSE